MSCECQLAGWCERHKRTKTDRMVWLCQNDAAYFDKWESSEPSKQTVKPQRAIGVGDLLKAKLQAYGYRETSGCDCKKMTRKMNRWKPDGCRKRIEKIINHLEESAKKTGWIERFALSLPGVKSVARSQLRKLVNEAIDQAEQLTKTLSQR